MYLLIFDIEVFRIVENWRHRDCHFNIIRTVRVRRCDSAREINRARRHVNNENLNSVVDLEVARIRHIHTKPLGTA